MHKTNDAFARGLIGLVVNAIASATLLVVSGCGKVPANGGADAGSDATSIDAATCEPDTTQCVAATETICGSDGFVQESKSCPLGCNDSGTTCADIVPSNNMGQYLDDAESGPDLELPAGTVIHTGAGTVLVNNSLVTVPNVLVEAPLFGVAVRVFRVASLKVIGAITIEGPAAIAFVSAGDIVIQGGHLSVDGAHQKSGPGAGPDGDGAGGVCVPNACRGDGGGGFGGRGGNGGAVGSNSGGTGGAVVGNETLVPLRGGGRSNGASGGGGGGSIQLVSRTNITVTAGGVVSAGGGAYTFNQVGGGGAGGGLLLEAPVVLVSGAGSALAANGGGGGCIAPSQVAENGRRDDQRARGCVSSDGATNGAGGAGGAGTASSSGIAGSAGSINGGGGGGGVGRIRVNARNGSFAVANGAIVSPQASIGTLPIR